jgi:hypothetical protein
MKLRNSFVTAGFAALALAGASVLGSAGSAQAMGLSFNPPGALIPDGDTIRDLVRVPGTSVTFDLVFDTGNLDKDSDVINDIIIDFGFDSDELIPPPTGSILGVATTPEHIYSVSYSNLGIKGNTGVHTLGSLKFELGKILPNDGIRDFFTTLRVVTGMVTVPGYGSTFNDYIISEANNKPQLYKEVEVQGVRPVPTPALLPGLAAFGMSLVRKRKQEQAV